MANYDKVIDRWLTGGKPLKNPRMPVDGDNIYSYGRHFLIARIDRTTNTVYVTTEKNSVTTKKHVWGVYWKAKRAFRVLLVPDPYMTEAENTAALRREYKTLLESKSLAAQHLWELNNTRTNYLALAGEGNDQELENTYQAVMVRRDAKDARAEVNLQERVRKLLTEWLIRYGASAKVMQDWCNENTFRRARGEGYLAFASGKGWYITPNGLEYLKNESIPD